MSITTFDAIKRTLSECRQQVELKNYSSNANDWVLFTLDELEARYCFAGYHHLFNANDLEKNFKTILNNLYTLGIKFIYDSRLKVFLLDKNQYIYGGNHHEYL